jgi:hypothetical protein
MVTKMAFDEINGAGLVSEPGTSLELRTDGEGSASDRIFADTNDVLSLNRHAGADSRDAAQNDGQEGNSLLRHPRRSRTRSINRLELRREFDDAGRMHTRGANRQRMPFDQAATQIIDHGRGLTSERFPMSQLRFEGDRIIAGERELMLGNDGIRRLCGHFGAPADYLRERLSPQLRDSVLQFHARSTGSGRTGLNDANSRILSRNGSFVDIGRMDLHTLGCEPVVQAIRDGFHDHGSTIEVHDLEIADEGFRLDVISPLVSKEVRRGDVIQGGVRVEHAYTGERATTIFAFIVRLVCRNGMVHRECVGSRETARTRRLDASRDDAESLQVDQVRRLVDATRKGLAEKLDSIRQLAQEKADEHQLEQLLRRARMHSRTVMDRLRESWAAEGGEQTAFGLFNALTRLGTHGTELSRRQRAMLTRLAGLYANRHAHLCPHCFSILAS